MSPLFRYLVRWSNGTRFQIYSASHEHARELAKSLERYTKARVVDVVDLPRSKRASR